MRGGVQTIELWRLIVNGAKDKKQKTGFEERREYREVRL
jgi:hypothetical protein